jgi:hypothetical protein
MVSLVEAMTEFSLSPAMILVGIAAIVFFIDSQFLSAYGGRL